MTGFFPSSKVQHAPPTATIARCAQCGLYKGCGSPKMEPYGNAKAGVLVVGEAPGETEDEQGRPFIGKAGRYLRGILNELGVNLDREALTTNALICRPPKNATPDADQISYCRPNLTKTLQSSKPHTIITLGRSALVSVMEPYWRELGPLERWVGWKIPVKGHWICPTYHPSYLLRVKNELLDSIFKRHLEQAFALDAPPPNPPDYTRQVECLYEEKDIYEAIREFDRAGEWCAFDYETNCLKPEYEKARIVAASISNGERTIAFPWFGDAIKAAGIFLRSERTKKICSNVKFEDRWTRFFLGHRVRSVGWDTMLAAHVLDNRQEITSIKFQALVRLGIASYNEKIEPYLKNGKTVYNRVEEIDLSDLLVYCGLDSVLEYHVAMEQRKEMGFDVSDA